MTPGNQTTIHSIIPNRVVPVKDILPLTLAGKTLLKTVKDIYMYVLQYILDSRQPDNHT